VGVAAVLLAVRVVPESRDSLSRGRPDLIGAGLLAACVGLVAFALVEAPDWGWGSAGFAGLLAASLACGVLVVMRSRRHHSPVIELELLRSRTFSGAFAASILYYAGFGAFVLSAVEFLTGVWRYSAVEAGLAIAPGPLMVLPFARLVAPRLAGLLGGPGRVAVIGCLVNALAQLLWLSQIQATPDYVTHLLPAQLLGGAGVGLSIPSLLGAGSASLTPRRFGTGSGILNMARQIGTVLGVAGLVAILSRVSHADPVAAYRSGLVLVITFFAAAAAVSAALLTGRPVPAASADPVLAVQDGQRTGDDAWTVDGARASLGGERRAGRARLGDISAGPGGHRRPSTQRSNGISSGITSQHRGARGRRLVRQPQLKSNPRMTEQTAIGPAEPNGRWCQFRDLGFLSVFRWYPAKRGAGARTTIRSGKKNFL